VTVPLGVTPAVAPTTATVTVTACMGVMLDDDGVNVIAGVVIVAIT
jgi:hypothetical protein